MAAATAQVPATMRSGTVRWVTGRSFETPSITKVDVPTPSICAPISISIKQMSTISGSRAALSIVLRPWARTAAITSVSVAPTLGKSSHTSAPVSCVDVATR